MSHSIAADIHYRDWLNSVQNTSFGSCSLPQTTVLLAGAGGGSAGERGEAGVRDGVQPARGPVRAADLVRERDLATAAGAERPGSPPRRAQARRARGRPPSESARASPRSRSAPIAVGAAAGLRRHPRPRRAGSRPPHRRRRCNVTRPPVRSRPAPGPCRSPRHARRNHDRRRPRRRRRGRGSSRSRSRSTRAGARRWPRTSVEHYGRNTWRLDEPEGDRRALHRERLVLERVEHVREQRPGRRARRAAGHVRPLRVDTDGTIYQLVPLTTACRHTVGLNWTAIGIEHVGTSDQAILSNRRQLDASLALTAWLMGELRHPAAERDRPQRERDEPVPPRALRPVAVPDPRRLEPRRHGALPRRPPPHRRSATASRSGRPPAGRSGC